MKLRCATCQASLVENSGNIGWKVHELAWNLHEFKLALLVKLSSQRSNTYWLSDSFPKISVLTFYNRACLHCYIVYFMRMLHTHHCNIPYEITFWQTKLL